MVASQALGTVRHKRGDVNSISLAVLVGSSSSENSLDRELAPRLVPRTID